MLANFHDLPLSAMGRIQTFGRLDHPPARRNLTFTELTGGSESTAVLRFRDDLQHPDQVQFALLSGNQTLGGGDFLLI